MQGLSLFPADDLTAAWHGWLAATELQALEDLARAGSAEVVFLRHVRPSLGWEYLDALAPLVSDAGFVIARVNLLSERAFDAFETLVRSIARSLAAPGMNESKRGIVALLDLFVAQRGARALADFDAAAARLGATGDLAVLARAYIESARKPRKETGRIDAWLSGTELARREEEPSALAALSPRTARRAMGEITQLVRVLGWKGTAVLLSGAEVITKLPEGRRADAYTVLRELVDNADGGRGMICTQVLIAGGKALFEGPRSIESLPPLRMRVIAPVDARDESPPPHRPCVDLEPPVGWSCPAVLPGVRAVGDGAIRELRAMIRAAQGLPPADPVVSMSVGHEKIDRTIDALFAHSALESSVFALLTGAYGTGKSHLLMHLTARALAERHPVLRLSLERLDADLGNPQRHFRRLLEHAALPLPGTPSALDRLVAWTRSKTQMERLKGALEDLAAGGGDAAGPSRKALGHWARSKNPAAAMESFLGGAELAEKPGHSNYRFDAYTRLLLWFALLTRLEGCGGPVLLIDEAENLYRGGSTRAERRTTLRSLSFYCGGTLPGACVVMAITPDALVELRREAAELLEDVAEQKTVLAWEDATMLKRRLTKLEPIEVPPLVSEQRIVLAFRVRATHAAVRGPVEDKGWSEYVGGIVKEAIPPREMVRRLVDRLERRWWNAPRKGP